MKFLKGFTVIELIVVISLIAIVSLAVSVRAPLRGTFDLSAQSTQLIRDIRFTQTLAMSLNSPRQIVFTPNSYQIQLADGTPVTHPNSNTPTINLTTDVTVSSTTILFDGNGRPNAPASLVITTDGETKTITVEAETGFAND